MKTRFDWKYEVINKETGKVTDRWFDRGTAIIDARHETAKTGQKHTTRRRRIEVIQPLQTLPEMAESN